MKSASEAVPSAPGSPFSPAPTPLDPVHRSAATPPPLPQSPDDELYAEAFQSDGGMALMWTARLAATLPVLDALFARARVAEARA